MSAVDVLAVLEATSAGLHSVASNCSARSELTNPMRERAEALDEARAAVAELIEAHRALLEMSDFISEHVPGAGWRMPQANARAALARCGGAP